MKTVYDDFEALALKVLKVRYGRTARLNKGKSNYIVKRQKVGAIAIGMSWN